MRSLAAIGNVDVTFYQIQIFLGKEWVEVFQWCNWANPIPYHLIYKKNTNDNCRMFGNSY